MTGLLTAAAGTGMAVLSRAADTVPPLQPGGDEARRWAETELSDPVYDIAEPTLLDRIAQAIGDFIGSLFSTELSGEWGSLVAVIAAVIVIAVIVIAFVVWGVPRSSRRVRASSATLFGEPEERSAADLRRAAASAARGGDWDDAIVLHFRALARGCAERGVVDIPPGATVHAFARAAGRVFPAIADRLEDAASAFDDVRYLRRPGTAEIYRLVAEVDAAVVAARPTAAVEVPA
ncbi:DUF4129 domain-containing protein [Microbacterium sp. SSM24]|uniref:DUF4129 domain-containing protein n=1 Tax=Microbacterium sp. SSM24 TaxID=2991714 RepID=UPI0022277DB7|nr:DUF4129 domain-containing protein [Microbacterium sp. SSM24]MCW3493785.1 DUF4129 domain-containing protein [Microbacterium sp. SSM24]